jgi:hypothetical protein
VSEPVLCYVSGSWAYFTTQPLEKQWGDDWNDAPYEHNAGRPYEWRDYNGEPRWEIVDVVFEGDFKEACEGHLNSPFSVEDINAGKCPWLRAWDGSLAIMAGTPVSQFKRLVKDSGGRVFVEEQ